MKTLVHCLALLASVLFLTCSDSGVNDTGQGSQGVPGSLSLFFSSPPPDIVQVVATISRPGFAPRTLSLAIQDSTQTASGSFNDVAIGLWHLKVDALNDSNVVRYTGETDVEVRPGQTAQVNLQLLPTSGGIRIIVSWGLPPVPAGGLMAYYPLDGTGNDASGNANHGVVSGAVPAVNRHGTPNAAMSFDGIDDKIVVPSSPSLHPLNQLTICFWMRVDSMTDNYMAVIHKGGEAQEVPWLANREYAVYLKNHIAPWYYFQAYSAGNGESPHVVIQQPPLQTGQWTFFTAVIDRLNHTMICYVNGVLNGQSYDSYSSFNVNHWPLTIGWDAETAEPDKSPFYGALDELRLYSRALSVTEIAGLYNAP